AQMLADPQKRFTRDDLIALGLASGEQQPVGTAAYSTTNYIILGELLQAVTGQSPERLVNAVFRRAGMKHARLPSAGAQLPAGVTHGYIGRMLPTQLPGTTVPAPDTDVTDWAFDWGREGGGAYATIGDLARWGSTCLGDSLLPNRLVTQRLQTHASNAGKYGLGIIRQGEWLAHSGQALGWTANVACNPKTGAVVAYATNSTKGTVDVPFNVGKVAFPAYAKAIGYGAL
ncbi:MAG: serine hydrolase domain-containing protein, partial [Actinomycetales bacterium]